MATPRKKAAAKLDAPGADAGTSPWAGALRDGVYEEDAVRHRWRLTTSDGRDLATSTASFATREQAQRAAGENRD